MRLIETENCLHKLVEEKSWKRKESETRPIGKTNIICKQKEIGRAREGDEPLAGISASTNYKRMKCFPNTHTNTHMQTVVVIMFEVINFDAS